MLKNFMLFETQVFYLCEYGATQFMSLFSRFIECLNDYK